jgi:hypothetical protein
MNRMALPLLVVLGLLGCKKGGTKDSQKTLDELKKAQDQLVADAQLIQKLRDENARLETESGGEIEWVFTINGDVLVLTTKPIKGGGGGGGGGSLDEATASAMTQKFIELVNKSKSNIQKCYEQVLKKSPSLQGRVVPLTIRASFAASGAFTKVSLSSGNVSIPSGFDDCFKNVASKWQLPAVKSSSTYQATVKLQPT